MRSPLSDASDLLEELSPAELEEFERRFLWVARDARPEQLTPGGAWKTWLYLAGRGAGKTRAAAEDVSAYGLDRPKSRIPVVAETFADGRDVCVEGESGLLAVLPPGAVRHWNRSLGELVLANGTRYKIYSGDRPDQLRGPQHHRAWTDELAKYQYPDETWTQLQLGLRLGDDPRNVVTTTPRAIPLIRDLVGRENVVVTTGSTFDNAENLSGSFLAEVRRQYEGTRLGEQELYGRIVELDGEAIFARACFAGRFDAEDDEARFAAIGRWAFFDTAFKEGAENDYTAWTVLELSPDYRARVVDHGAERLAFPDLVSRVESVAGRHGHDGRLRGVVIEDRGSGMSLLQTLGSASSWLSPLLERFDPGSRKKTERARQAAVWCRQGCVLLPKPDASVPWLYDLEEELFQFPNAKHDDRTDSFVMGVLWLENLLAEGLAFRGSA